MTAGQALPLRERKKLRTRQALAETALAMFTERGFEATTLDALVEKVYVSKRTFFRNFRSKEDVAVTAVTQFWETYLEVLAERQMTGPLLDGLRDTLLATVDRMDGYWFRQFGPTMRLIQASPALNGYCLRYCAEVQREIVQRLDRGDSLELRLLVQTVITAWRYSVDEWSGSGELTPHVERAFAAIPRSITLR